MYSFLLCLHMHTFISKDCSVLASVLPGHLYPVEQQVVTGSEDELPGHLLSVYSPQVCILPASLHVKSCGGHGRAFRSSHHPLLQLYPQDSQTGFSKAAR